MTVVPGELALTLVQGATFHEVVQLETSPGVPMPIIGYAARMQIRNLFADISPDSVSLITVTCVVVDAMNGIVDLSAPASDTQAISFTTYGTTLFGQLEIFTAGDADVQRPLNITFEFAPEITR